MKKIILLAMCTMASIAIMAQNTRLVKGLVFNNEDIPMKGVTLSVVGMEGTTTSDENGLFELYVSPYAKKLNASMEGYISQTAEIDGSYLVFKLKVDKEYLQRKAEAERAAAEEKARIAAEKELAERMEAAAKAKAEEEARIAAEKEAAAKAKAEEKARIAAEKEATAKAKAEEEARIAAEKEATAKAKAASQTGNNKINTVCIHGKEGVILSLSDDGEHGKLISVEYHTVLNWKDSQKWYSDLGADWRLPSREELQTLKSLISQNEIDHSFTAIYGDADYFWTNEEHSKDKAWLVSLRNGSSYIQNKNFVCKVLVIYEF